MKKREYKILFFIGVIGIIFISLLCAKIIIELNQLQKVERKGQPVSAYIMNRDPGLLRIAVRYQINGKIYERNLRVSNVVYNKYADEDMMEIRVLSEEPTIVTWEGNRFFQTSIFNLILLVFGGTIMLIVFLIGFSDLRRNY